MSDRLVGATDNAPGSGVAEVLTQERPSGSITTTTTADPGSGGTSLAVTLRDKFPQTGPFKIKVENEIMLVTAGFGTGAGSFTVTRGQDGTTAVAHTSGVTVAQLAAAQYMIPISNRSVTFCGAAASWRTLGNAASGQDIFTIENQAGSAVIVGVSRLVVEMDSTVVLTAVAPQFKTYRATALPSGGTVLTKNAIDTAMTSSASVVLRGATASDGGAATAITVSPPATNPLWHQYLSRLHTAVGQVLCDEYSMLPSDIADVDWVSVRAGEALGIEIVGTAASNAATNHYVVKCAWFEYTIP